MDNKTEIVEVTIDTELYNEVGKIFKKFNITHEEAIELFLKEITSGKPIPEWLLNPEENTPV